jgi:hypothetical protein
MTTEDTSSFQRILGQAEVVRLALRELDDEDSVYPRIRDALEAALADPGCPLTELGHAELDQLEALLLDLDQSGEAAVDEALQVSLRRLRCETGWDPRLLPVSQPLLEGVGLTYLLTRNALGTLALAWQVQAHPLDVILTVGKFILAFK